MQYFSLTPEAEKHFPSHGWLRGYNGVRHLRLPVLRLYQCGQPTYDRFVENEISGMWLQFRSPFRTLRQLAIGLRDLHRESREMLSLSQEDWFSREPSIERDNACTQRREVGERIEILLIAVLVLLRRLGDELMDASRPFLFKDWKSAPQKLTSAVSKARDGTLARTKPICDFDILSDALLNHTGWLDQLRRNNGIRDIVVHQAHVLSVGSQGSKRSDDTEFQWRVSAQLATLAPGVPHNIDLFPALADCIAGVCRFMDRLYCCATPLDQYQKGDLLFLTGSDNDVVGFWPPIHEEKTDFPMTA
jgi:hypothetical protein